MLELAALVVAVVVVLAASFSGLARRWRFWRDMEKLPGFMALPLFGTTYKFIFTKREDFLQQHDGYIKMFWPILRSWFGSVPAVEIMKPEHLEKIMSSADMLGKEFPYSIFRPWLGDGLINSQGKTWQIHRKMITPTFHFRILDNFVEIFADKAEILVEKLKSKADGRPIDIYPFVNMCALDVICETAMGTKINAQEDANSSYVKAVCRVGEITIMRINQAWLQNDFIFRMSSVGKEFYKDLNVIHGFSREVIRQRREVRKANGGVVKPKEDELGRKRRVAFLDMILDASDDGQKLTDKEVQEEVDTFIFAGHDTTSVAMTWALLLLGHHPEVQEKVYAELRDIFLDDPKRRISPKDLPNMKYLEMVLKECLRLYPSVSTITRLANKDIDLGGYKIPAGCNVIMHIRHALRDPDHWPNPEKFDPERFLPERSQGRHPYAYVPFSAGPRNCIGQKFALVEEKTVLSYLLRNFRFESVERLEDLKVVAEMVLRPINGAFLRITPR